jgi:hypothetical protein
VASAPLASNSPAGRRAKIGVGNAHFAKHSSVRKPAREARLRGFTRPCVRGITVMYLLWIKSFTRYSAP